MCKLKSLVRAAGAAAVVAMSFAAAFLSQAQTYPDRRITKIADMPETQTFLGNVASLPLKGTPAEMVVKLEKDIQTWAEIAKAGNIVPQ
jgi:tripartite-type tricarboxylate transporter receptor subunit TctC